MTMTIVRRANPLTLEFRDDIGWASVTANAFDMAHAAPADDDLGYLMRDHNSQQVLIPFDLFISGLRLLQNQVAA